MARGCAPLRFAVEEVMDGLLGMLNHILAAWLRQLQEGEDWIIHEVRLDSQGGFMRAEVTRGDFQGEVVIRFHAGPPREARQTLHVAVEQWPAHMPEALERFRKVLEKARLQIDLDFSP